MSITQISAELRRFVADRADNLCEYCLIAGTDTYWGCQVDHVISEKHGGSTEAKNLAHACACCNRAKGSDIGSLHCDTGEFVRFFNPRTDRWADHFVLVEDRLEPLTNIGAVTARILKLNSAKRLLERRLLQSIGRFPSVAARNKMRQ